MDKLTVHCPVCTASLRALPAHIGKKAQCTKCGHRFAVAAPQPLLVGAATSEGLVAPPLPDRKPSANGLLIAPPLNGTSMPELSVRRPGEKLWLAVAGFGGLSMLLIIGAALSSSASQSLQEQFDQMDITVKASPPQTQPRVGRTDRTDTLPSSSPPEPAVAHESAPAQRESPSEPAPEKTFSFDRFFVVDLDLTPDDRNLTYVYMEQYEPERRTLETIIEFAKQQRIVTQLPAVDESHILKYETDSDVVVRHYVSNVEEIGVGRGPTVMSHIFHDLFGDNDGGSAYGEAIGLRDDNEDMKKLRVPPCAIGLHKALLGLTEIACVTYTQIASYNGDPMKTLVAINQLGVLDCIYSPVLSQEVRRLQGTPYTKITTLDAKAEKLLGAPNPLAVGLNCTLLDSVAVEYGSEIEERVKWRIATPITD